MGRLYFVIKDESSHCTPAGVYAISVEMALALHPDRILTMFISYLSVPILTFLATSIIIYLRLNITTTSAQDRFSTLEYDERIQIVYR